MVSKLNLPSLVGSRCLCLPDYSLILNETHHFMYNFFFSSFFDIPNSKSLSNASQSSMYIHVVHVVHVHVVHITVRNSQRNITSFIPRSHGTIFLRNCYLGQLCPVTLGYSDKNLKKYSQSQGLLREDGETNQVVSF